jgi:hypothetical protein
MVSNIAYPWTVNNIETAVSEIIKGRESSKLSIKLCHRDFSKVTLLKPLIFEVGVLFWLSTGEILFKKTRSNDNISSIREG